MRIYRALIPAVLMVGMLALPAPSSAAVSIGISVGIAPPPLPIYEQPLIPGPGYFWTPGYWAYGPLGYYWVPGTWVLPPTVGFLWTPPWWGWGDGGYLWHGGYWGPHVGFYGGINYGYGYSGVGYEGGYWDHQRFFYNREANNIGNANFANVYSKSVAGSGRADRVSFNGGTGGIAAQPTAQEQAAMHDRHLQATALQTQHVNAARSNRSQLATTNNGQPPVTAISRAGRFNATTGNATALGATSGPKVQGNTRSTGNATALGATSGPKVQSNTRTSRTMGTAPNTVGQSAPNNGGQGSSKTLGQAGPKNVSQSQARNVSRGAPRNAGQGAPRNVSQGAQKNVGQGGSNAIHPAASQGNARPATNQRIVTPNAHPTGKGAPAQGQEQPKG
jgi:YXWGXW repeat-containing protein